MLILSFQLAQAAVRIRDSEKVTSGEVAPVVQGEVVTCPALLEMFLGLSGVRKGRK